MIAGRNYKKILLNLYINYVIIYVKSIRSIVFTYQKFPPTATNWSLLRPFMNNRNQRKFSVKYLCFLSEIRQKKLRIPEKISRPEMKLSVHSKFHLRPFEFILPDPVLSPAVFRTVV